MNYDQLRSSFMEQIMQAVQQEGVAGLAPGVPVETPPAAGRPVTVNPHADVGQPSRELGRSSPEAGLPLTAEASPLTAQAPKMDAVDLAKRAWRRRQKEQALRQSSAEQFAGPRPAPLPTPHRQSQQFGNGYKGNPWTGIMQKPKRRRSFHDTGLGWQGSEGGGAFNGGSPLG